jgi:hypothetical protein
MRKKAPGKAKGKPAPKVGPRQTLVFPATLAEIARALGYSERQFQRHKEAGAIEALKPGAGPKPAVYDLVAIARMLINRPEDSRMTRDAAQAEWLQLRIQKERRELLPAGEVQRAGRGLVHAATARLLRLGADMVRLGVIPAKKQGEVDAVVREALESLAALTKLAEAAA